MRVCFLIKEPVANEEEVWSCMKDTTDGRGVPSVRGRCRQSSVSGSIWAEDGWHRRTVCCVGGGVSPKRDKEDCRLCPSEGTGVKNRKIGV